jgi:plastocyanin
LDPEQVYQEVLQEEQQKGSSPSVAEGRAKAARVRTEHGSPTPKEPKWWPGSQPQFEGGNGAAPAEAEEAAPQVAAAAEPAEPTADDQMAAEAPAEEPAAEAQPAAQAPAEQPSQAPAEQPAAEAPAEAQPAAQAPAEQPAAQAPAEQPAAAAAPAAVATAEAPAPAPAATVGVKPGVPTGNRLRPEDAVSTEAQFDGQRAMEQRRKLIDELVATGVPAVTAAQTGRERSPWISVLFLIVPLLAILFIVSNSENLGGGSAAEGETTTSEGGGGGAPEGTVVAEQTAFNTDTIELKAGGQASIPFENKDPFDHNIAIYENAADAETQENAIFDGDLISASSTTYEFPAPPKGEYPFQCDLHPTTMTGTVIVQ